MRDRTSTAGLPRGSRTFLSLSLALQAACASAGVPAPPIAPDRPGFSDGTAIVAPGTVQLSVGYSAAAVGDGATSHAIGEGLLRLPLHERAELRVHGNSYALDRVGASTVSSGFQDPRLSIKVALLPEARGPRPAVTAVLGSSLPLGSATFRASGPVPEAKLALGWSFTERVGLTSNLGYASLIVGDERVGQTSGTAALGMSVSESVSVFAEYLGTHIRGDGRVRSLLDGGVGYRIGNNLQVDAWAGVALDSHPRTGYVGFGLSRQW